MERLRVYCDGPRTGSWNMARDTDLLAAHAPGDEPVLRIYGWEPAAVTIGYNQNFDSFDRKAIAAAGYDMVRRPTGGRAILHADELTYAVIGTSPGPVFGDTLHSSYLAINRALIFFFENLGLAVDVSEGESRAAARGLACFNSAGKYEIKVGGQKLVGSAQRRTGGVFLQHGSILTGPRHLGLSGLLGKEGRGTDLAQVTTDLASLLGRPQTAADLARHTTSLIECFGRALDLAPCSGGDFVPPTTPFT